ncbi:glycosyltransferase [Sphingobacterium sp. SGG-5]|uniref:glycosyltransferase family 2 protein n=1 Tax=Sphingobacterium sp. SGG-5 TaxID=2710881 RepID=UPI0013EB24A2|nr:glycosyltransferase family 2 protein [Sphingobacterium sp. SGG-5]NGM63275.1 glycosyltransferase [Sphingobacterium sp. SGG-5]
MKLALLISTYNRPDALELCLISVFNQTELPDEILVADDGSGEMTKRLIEKYQTICNIPMVHVWHEDTGFELAKIRNKAIAQSTSDYIVQIDGDLILHPFFIRDHREFAREGSFVRASRIYLDEDLSQQKIQNLDYHVNRFEKGMTNFFSAFRLPFMWKYFETKYKTKGNERWEIHGCNMAFWRKDAIAVNGYNEDFNGWGPEDKEFVARLLNKGLQKRFLKFGGLVFHLWHPINTKENLKDNESLFEHAKRDGIVYCQNGIDKYLKVKDEG